jgi:membrane protease YdiL (CAAX protease family)
MSYLYGSAPPRPPDPPAPPERADPRPRWPAWYAPVGFLVAFGVTVTAFVAVGALAAIAGADLDDDNPTLTIVGTFIQAVVLMGTAVFFAARTSTPKPWHFGLTTTRFGPALGWSALGLVGFYLFAATYTALFEPEGEQTVAEDLGADEGTLALVVAGIVVIVVAPIAEEFFFRGFFYRALRTRFGVLWAAAIDGAVFGAIHFTGSGTLSILPILGFLGFVLCLIYERTGSLYPVIALHAVNNSIAYTVVADDSAAIALALGVAMVAACLLLPRSGAWRAPALR